MKPNLINLITKLGNLTNNLEDQSLVSAAISALDETYSLSLKIGREPGLEDIMIQLVGRIIRAYGGLTAVKAKRILDIACGSNTSKAPSFIYINTPFKERRIPISAGKGYTAQFEPWFCRILLELGAHPVGIDLGNLDGESFEHYHVDLGLPGGLDFLPDHSFDAVHDSRLFGSPEFTAQFPGQTDRLKIAAEIRKQELRLLKEEGIIIHSDAADLVR